MGVGDVGKELYAIADTNEKVDFDKLEEVFDNDYGVKVGDKINFCHMASPPYYDPNPFRVYEKKEQKEDIINKYRNIPRLS